MATRTVEAVEWVAVIAGLLSSVVHAKLLLRPETRLWPLAALFEGPARGHNLSAALLPNVLRAGVHLQSGAGVDHRRRHKAGLHRAWRPLGERLLRELQIQSPR